MHADQNKVQSKQHSTKHINVGYSTKRDKIIKIHKLNTANEITSLYMK